MDAGIVPTSQDRQPQSTTSQLTSVRQERKRASDRESQKAVRARNKRYVAHLESTLETLTQSSDYQRSSALLAQLGQQHEEIERLRGILNTINKLVRIDGLEQDGSTTDRDGAAAAQTGTTLALGPPDVVNGLSGRLFSPTFSSYNPLQSGVFEQPSLFPPFAPMPAGRSYSSVAQQDSALVPKGYLTCNGTTRNYFGALGDSLARVHNADPRNHFSHPVDDDDIAIRIVLHGWEAAKLRYPLDVAWQVLEEVDLGMFRDCGSIERFAILRFMRSMLIHKIRPTNQPERAIPQFLIPTELQKSVAHAPLIDYFVWPALRDQLILSRIDYGSEVSANLFARSFKFLWPHGIEDIYVYHTPTDRYLFSPKYLECMDDVQAWQLSIDLQVILPQFRMSGRNNHSSETTMTSKPPTTQHAKTKVVPSQSSGLETWTTTQPNVGTLMAGDNSWATGPSDQLPDGPDWVVNNHTWPLP